MVSFLRAILSVGLLWATGFAAACPFCAKLTRSAADDVRESDVVFLATLSEARHGDGSDPSTAFRAITIVKRHPVLDAVPSIGRVGKYVPGAKYESVERVVFARVDGNRIVPTRIETATPAFVQYLTGLAAHLDSPQAERLAKLFDYLDAADTKSAQDAYAEFAKASYRSTVVAARAFDRKRIRRWLGDESAPPERVGLFGLMLGLCGEPADADLLEGYLDEAQPRHVPGLDGMLAGLCILDQTRGREKVVQLLTRENSSPVRRMAAMSTLSFLMTELPPKDPLALLERTAPALKYPEVASPLIDEFRRAKCWKPIDPVLALAGSDRDRPAVLRFALSCPDPKAAEFVKTVEHEQPAAILDARQAIEFERSTRAIGAGNSR